MQCTSTSTQLPSKCLCCSLFLESSKLSASVWPSVLVINRFVASCTWTKIPETHWSKALCYWKIIIQTAQQYHHFKFPIFSHFEFSKSTLKDYLKNSSKVVLVPSSTWCCLPWAILDSFSFSEHFLFQRTEVYKRSLPWCKFTAAEVEKNDWLPKGRKIKLVFILKSQKRRLWIYFF